MAPRFRFSREAFYSTTPQSRAGDLWIFSAMRSAWLIAVAMLLCAAIQPPAVAITINMEYSTDFGGDESPSWDANGAILIAHFQAAKQIWEALLPGSGDISFDFQWDDDLGATTFGQYTPGIDEYIEINPLWYWFADPTPNNSNEFAAPVQTLYSQVDPELQSSHFPFAVPPGALEVGYRGAGLSSGTLVNGVPVNTRSASGQIIPGTNPTYVDANNGYDLLSTIVHEIGHALGLSGIEPGNYNILPQHVGGLENVEVLEGGGGHLAGQGNVPYLMCEGCGNVGVRRFATATDILVIAEEQGITNVHLDRVGRIDPGDWGNANAWIGGDVPDSTQDVYITHGSSVTVNAAAQAQNLRVASGNSVDIASSKLSVAATLTNAGTVSLGTTAILEADRIDGDPALLTTTPGSLVRFNQFTRGASSVTSVAFNGSVAIGYGAEDASPVTFASGPITTWTVAENLNISDPRPATVNVNNATWNVGGNVEVGRYNVIGSTLGKLDIQAGGTVTIGGNLQVDSGSEVTVGPSRILDVVGQINVGGRVAYTNSSARAAAINISGGSTVIIPSPPAIYPFEALSSGGEVTFDGGLAGVSVVDMPITVAGGGGNAAPGGKLTFKGSPTEGSSSAAFAQIVNYGGVPGPSLSFGTRAGLGGETRFEGTSRASSANIRNDAVVADQGGSGGRTVFVDDSSAGDATINNYGTATYASRQNGTTAFSNTADAGTAEITNHPTNSSHLLPDNASAPRTTFYGTSTAANATITNKGYIAGGLYQGGRTFFRENSTAGDATIINEGGGNGGATYVGGTIFYDNSNAGTATLLAKTVGGRIEFLNNSSAADATLIIETSPGVISGQIGFSNNSKAGTADFTIEPNGYIPLIHFIDNTSAEQAEFDLMDGSRGKLLFQGSSTADRADIDVGSTAALQFNSDSQIGDATIRVRRGGGMQVGGSSVTAGNATINIEGALFHNGPRGYLSFGGVGSGPGSATITIQGGNAVNAQGGQVEFDYGARGENATIIVGSGTVAGALGGTLNFGRGANGENVRVVNQQGGFVNVSGNLLHIAKTTMGSIEGAGTIQLGGVELETGSRNTDDTISGPITDHVSSGLNGRITKVGTGTLTLSGTNTYTGLTTVIGGALVMNGSNVGGTEVNAGTLKGSGSFGGAVTIKSGGTLAPGASPGKMTVGGLSLLAGSTLAMELGGIAPGTQYDQVISTGAFSLAGALQVSLINGFAPAAGQSFNLFDWGTVSGTFSTLSLPTLGSTLGWNTSELYTSGVLSIASADYNQNNSVDAADYVLWRKTNGAPAGYDLWRGHFGETTGNGSAATQAQSATVPEPSTAFLLAMAAFLTQWPSRQFPR